MKKIYKIALFFIQILLILQFFIFNQTSVCYAKSEKFGAESMITIERTSGRVLFSKDEHKRLPMASTTKILTAIVAIENIKDLDEKHQISKSACGIEGSGIYLKQGEHLSVRELLYGLMLRSGNDSAVAIAEIVSGSVEKFVEKMNSYVNKLGLKDTHIVTVNGLHDDNHYTSAYDLAKITAYALSNKTFAEIVSTKKTKISNEYSKYSDKVRMLKNKNKLLSMVEGADGVKTGYTKKAGKCFVGSATRDGMQIIVVVLNSRTMFEGAAECIEKAFLNYKMVKLFDSGKVYDIDVENIKTQKIPILIKKDIVLPLNKEEIANVKAKVKLNNNKASMISSDDVVGTIDVWVKNNLIFLQNLYTINIDKEECFEDYLKKIINGF